MQRKIVTWGSPMTSVLQKQFSMEVQQRYPWMESEVLTWTSGGREVEAVKVGCGKRTVLLTAGHHANESITSLLLWRFLEDYCCGLKDDGSLYGFSCRRLFRRSTLYLVPLVNPDGCDLVAGTATEEEVQRAKNLAASQPQVRFPEGWKANLQGVDLNLNYPARWEMAKAIKPNRPGPRDYPGKEPLDQPETAALAEYVRRVQPDVLAAWHTQGREIYADGDDRLSRLLERCSGYVWAEVPPQSRNAGLRDWFLQEFQRVGVTVEAGFGENPLPLSQLPQIYDDNLPIFILLLAGIQI